MGILQSLLSYRERASYLFARSSQRNILLGQDSCSGRLRKPSSTRPEMRVLAMSARSANTGRSLYCMRGGLQRRGSRWQIALEYQGSVGIAASNTTTYCAKLEIVQTSTIRPWLDCHTHQPMVSQLLRSLRLRQPRAHAVELGVHMPCICLFCHRAPAARRLCIGKVGHGACTIAERGGCLHFKCLLREGRCQRQVREHVL